MRRTSIDTTSPYEDCAEYIDLGPFRFECDGHLPGVVERAVTYHDGKIAHHATSPQEVGDVDVTFWTQVDMNDWCVVAGTAFRNDGVRS